jgi:hypothetical protein
MNRRSSGRPGLTLIELLVTAAAVAMLVALLFPAVHASREVTRANRCQANLRQLTLAVGLHTNARGTLPHARSEGMVGVDLFRPAPGPTWLWTIRRYIDEGAGNEWPRGKAYDDVSESSRMQVMPLFLCPTRRTADAAISEKSVGPPRLATCGCILPGDVVEAGAVSDYAGNQGDLSPGSDAFFKGGRGTGTIVSSRVLAESNRPVDLLRLEDVVDGLSATLLIGEAHARQDHFRGLPDVGPAYDGSQFHFTTRVGGPGVGIGSGPNDDLGGTAWMAFGSWHPRACQVSFADGRVGRLSPDLGPDILVALCNRADGTLRTAAP